jgi:hypothetical protein
LYFAIPGYIESTSQAQSSKIVRPKAKDPRPSHV